MSDARTVLAEWQQRIDQATNGPWKADITPYGVGLIDPNDEQLFVETYGITWAAEPADAEFIATSREAMPKLLAAVEAVLAIKPRTVGPEPYTLIEFGDAVAYNTGLAEARRAINDALKGKTE